MGEVTEILERMDHGGGESSEQLLTILYDELRRLAALQLAHEKPGQTLQATALVHEAWLRLIVSSDGEPDPAWQGRRHFLAAAAEAMRRILVEKARKKQCARHGGGLSRIDMEKLDVAAAMPSEELLALDEALQELSILDPSTAGLVKLRFFAGFSIEEVCRILGISRRSADRMWAFGRAWLYRAIRG
jgi:RNA polymerase sigma factor (TIGR02999 family)